MTTAVNNCNTFSVQFVHNETAKDKDVPMQLPGISAAITILLLDCMKYKYCY